MDLGVYPIGLLRYLFGGPTVLSAAARDRHGVDAWANARLAFANGVEGEVITSMWSRRVFASALVVRGRDGTLKVSMPYQPQQGATITITKAQSRTRERSSGRSSYAFQLEAFRNSIRMDAPVITDPRHALATMKVIDAVYRAAGMEPRSALAATTGYRE